MVTVVGTDTQDLMKSLGELEAAADQLDQGIDTEVQKSIQGSDSGKSKKDKPIKAEDVSDDNLDDDGNDGEGNDDNDGEGNGDNDDEDDEDVGKSVKAIMEGNEDVQKALEVSDFLLALTEATSDAIEGIRKSVNDSISSQSQISNVMVKSVNALAKAQTSIIKSIDSIRGDLANMVERMDALERVPMTRKSISSAGVNVVERPLAKSVGAAASTTLSKSEVAAKMSDMILKGEPGITAMDVLSFEAGAELRPEVKAKLGMI